MPDRFIGVIEKVSQRMVLINLRYVVMIQEDSEGACWVYCNDGEVLKTVEGITSVHTAVLGVTHGR